MISSNTTKYVEDATKEKIKHIQSIPGGSQAHCYKVIFHSGKIAFLKIGNYSLTKEANGLKELEKANVINTPKIYAAKEDTLLLEWIEKEKPQPNFWQNFGKQFAQLHKYKATTFGFHEDNYIGKTPQINVVAKKYQTNWLDFYHEHRLTYQINLAKVNGYINKNFTDIFQKFSKNLPHFFNDSENEASLLHGDLWSGNYMITNNQPVLIDPAAYYGNRETDLAMTLLFGGFPPQFYNSYNQEYPLPQGYKKRIPIYQLYHILNHLNLFGQSYFGQAIAIMEDYC